MLIYKYTASNGRISGKWLIKNDLNGNGDDHIEVLSQHLQNCKSTKSDQLVLWLLFYVAASQIHATLLLYQPVWFTVSQHRQQQFSRFEYNNLKSHIPNTIYFHSN